MHKHPGEQKQDAMAFIASCPASDLCDRASTVRFSTRATSWFYTDPYACLVGPQHLLVDKGAGNSKLRGL